MTPTGREPSPLMADVLRAAMTAAFPLAALEALLDRMETPR